LLLESFCVFIATAGGCSGVSFDLPRDNQVTDYVRYRSYFPALNEGTVCFWIDTTDYNTVTGIFSYAVPGSNNEILLGFENPGAFLFYVRGRQFSFNITPELSGAQKVRN